MKVIEQFQTILRGRCIIFVRFYLINYFILLIVESGIFIEYLIHTTYE